MTSGMRNGENNMMEKVSNIRFIKSKNIFFLDALKYFECICYGRGGPS